jgi:hypothetical protein
MVELSPTIIIDDFLDNPDFVREKALGMQFYTDKELDGSWPGRRTNMLHTEDPALYDYLWDKIYGGWDLDRDAPGRMELSFQLCTEKDGDSWIHQDHGRDFVALVYLTPNPPPKSGTSIYTPVLKSFNHYDRCAPSNYRVKSSIPNKYNRFVAYDPREFHCSDNYFGSTKEDARLFLVVFMTRIIL